MTRREFAIFWTHHGIENVRLAGGDWTATGNCLGAACDARFVVRTYRLAHRAHQTIRAQFPHLIAMGHQVSVRRWNPTGLESVRTVSSS